MPPKKRGRVPSRAASTPSGGAAEHATEESAIPARVVATQDELLSDPWTDEQETSLFKAMIRWKPVGMHKHFRMIAISEHLRSQGHNGYIFPQNAHITIPRIWEKLGSLYNLEVLDMREDNIGDPIEGEGEEPPKPFYEFVLPDDDYRHMKFARRLASEASSSPPSLPYQLSNLRVEGGRPKSRYSTVDDTDEPRSSPASARGTPSSRNTRASKGTRNSRLAEVSVPGGRHARKGSDEQGSEDEGDDDAMEVDENDKKAPSKDKGKASKGAAAKASRRRSGRKK